jgi:integrase
MARKPKENTDTKNLMKRGRTWYIKRMVDGRVIMQSTGQTGIDEARKERDRVLNPTYLRDEKERTEAVLAKVESLDRKLTQVANELPSLGILAAWTAYKNAPNRPDSGPRTMAGYESQFDRFTDWMRKNHPAVTELRGVTEEIAFQFAGDLGRTLTPNSFNKYLVLFRRMWKVLHKTARLTCNPWENLDNKLLATHSRRELTIEELTTVCAAVSGEMRVLFAVGLYCGLRLGDAVLLKWSNVDLIRRLMMIVPAKTARRSNGKVLRIPLHGSLYAMLAETPEEDRRVYVMPELAALYERDDTALVKRISRVFEECSIKTRCKVEGYSRLGVDVGFHSLRHSFVSLSANAGSSLAAVQAVVGHSNPAMTRHYLHADQSVVKTAVYALPDVTGAVPTPDPADTAKAEKTSILTTLEGMTAKTWKADRDKLLSMLKRNEITEVQKQSGAKTGTSPTSTPVENPTRAVATV